MRPARCCTEYKQRVPPPSLPAGKIGMSRFKVATKANPWRKEDGSHDFSAPTYGLRPGLVKEQLRRSVRALG